MIKQLRLGGSKMKSAYWSLVGTVSAMIFSMQPVMAATIWDRFSAIMQDIYGQIVAISTIVAVTVGAIALIIRMVSRNQRAVDEATQWLKRIVITWIILNSLGFIVAYLQPLIACRNIPETASIRSVTTELTHVIIPSNIQSSIGYHLHPCLTRMLKWWLCHHRRHHRASNFRRQ